MINKVAVTYRSLSSANPGNDYDDWSNAPRDAFDKVANFRLWFWYCESEIVYLIVLLDEEFS
jgi:hypothetical protein